MVMDPMQVFSGPVSKEKGHFEAPAAPLLEKDVGIPRLGR
jgi:hypothetical protein